MNFDYEKPRSKAWGFNQESRQLTWDQIRDMTYEGQGG